MKAAVCREFGKPLVIEELDIDPPKDDEVKVKMAATAVCHSDIHVFMGELWGTTPLVGGHESAGYIDEVGKDVKSVKPGDPVVMSLLASCGKCSYCRTGRSHLCSYAFPLDSESRIRGKDGKTIPQLTRTGSFAEYAVVHESQVVKIPADMPMDCASLLACGVITGFGAVVNRAKVRVSSSCVIIGNGGVGLNAVQGAAISGAYPVIAVDVTDSKLKAALTFGATHTVNPKKEDVVEKVKKITGGGAEYVFVTVGNADAIIQGFNMLRPGGMTVIVGLPNAKDTITLSPLMFIKDEKTITASYMGSTELQTDVPKMIELYKAGILKLDELITARYPLERINEAIDAVIKGKALRNVIMF
jgi:S-(hydroxymethyl)glutathione dehydrogenase/alcohol dehydrogenase